MGEGWVRGNFLIQQIPNVGMKGCKKFGLFLPESPGNLSINTDYQIYHNVHFEKKDIPDVIKWDPGKIPRTFNLVTN